VSLGPAARREWASQKLVGARHCRIILIFFLIALNGLAEVKNTLFPARQGSAVKKIIIKALSLK